MNERQDQKFERAHAGEIAREDEGPIHGSTPPHGDILTHHLAPRDAAEFDDDAEEEPLVRTNTAM